jgi:hypothetical protein
LKTVQAHIASDSRLVISQKLPFICILFNGLWGGMFVRKCD